MTTQDNEYDDVETDGVGLYWVGLFLVDLAYGGPEEGGWYFDAGTLVVDPQMYGLLGRGPGGFVDSDDARAHAEAMEQHLDEFNRGRPEKSSVNSVGVFEVRVFRTQIFPAHFPATIPRYE